MNQYHDKESEHEILNKGCFIPLFLFAISFLLIYLAHYSSQESRENDKETNTTFFTGISNNDSYKENEFKSKLYKDCKLYQEQLPKKIDDHTYLTHVEFTGKDIYFKYLIIDKYDEIFNPYKYKNTNKEKLFKRIAERKIASGAIMSDSNFNIFDITFHYTYYNRAGEKIVWFNLYSNYIKEGFELYELNGELYKIPYYLEESFIQRNPKAEIPNDTIGVKHNSDSYVKYKKTIYEHDELMYAIPDSLIDNFLFDNPDAKRHLENANTKNITNDINENKDKVETISTSNQHKSNTLKERIRNYCKEVNKSLPIRIDDYTSLETVLFTGQMIHMRYLVSDIVKEVMDDEIRKQQKQDVKNSLKNMIKEFGGVPRDLELLGINFHYIYSTKKGDVVLQFTLSPKELN